MLREEANYKMRQHTYNPVLVGNSLGTINRKPNHSDLIEDGIIFLTLKSQTIQRGYLVFGISPISVLKILSLQIICQFS